ncbi:MAG: 16S rRNA (cytidine(1402)-2'-O)-methyltransferase [Patescibacteria group bacterium]|jgi:16S rRNA (cytidine1402-2'-O)-methyltransferase
MSKLYVVATPIGNLEDITQRALRILAEVDFIVCEDTRHSLEMLNYFKIKKSLISYHQHSQVQKVDHIIDLLKQGKNIAMVSDAGTPGLSDPGGVLIEAVLEELGKEVEIIPIPGPTALTAIISVAGVPTDRFLFLGFLPHKKGRQTLFQEIKDSERTVIFYESTHRIIKALTSLAEVLEPERRIVVGRELTKKFETIYRGTAQEVLKLLETGETRGEFVVVVEGIK